MAVDNHHGHQGRRKMTHAEYKRVLEALEAATQYGVHWTASLGINGDVEVIASTRERELNITVGRIDGKQVITSSVTRKKETDNPTPEILNKIELLALLAKADVERGTENE